MRNQDAVVPVVVAPFLPERGFRRSGRTFVRENAAGDGAVVHFQQRRDGGYELEFFVNLGVFFRSFREWNARHDGHMGCPTVVDGLWQSRLIVPGRHWSDDPDQWRLDPDDVVGLSQFQGVLRHALDHVDHLADRGRMLDALRKGEVRVEELLYPPPYGTAMLLVDSGPDDELQSLLTEIEARDGAEDELLLWLRDRASSRQSDRTDLSDGQGRQELPGRRDGQAAATACSEPAAPSGETVAADFSGRALRRGSCTSREG
jgi:hypothetical protein